MSTFRQQKFDRLAALNALNRAACPMSNTETHVGCIDDHVPSQRFIETLLDVAVALGGGAQPSECVYAPSRWKHDCWRKSQNIERIKALRQQDMELIEMPEWAEDMFKNDHRTAIESGYQLTYHHLWTRTLHHVYWGLRVHVVCYDEHIERNINICKSIIERMGATDKFEIGTDTIRAVNGKGIATFGELGG